MIVSMATCDNTSVGVIVENQAGQILLIERKVYNPGWALPAGHLDGSLSIEGAVRELKEEVGLSAERVEEVLHIKIQNPCKRENGGFHDWTIYKAHVVSGRVLPEEREVTRYSWYTREGLERLAERLIQFMQKHNLSFDDFPKLVKATNDIPEWRENPGLEPPMYVIFKKLGLIGV